MAKILIIEDDETMAEMLADSLIAQKHVVEKVHDGADGLACLRSYNYDLVVLDWMLPRVNGVDICKQFKACSTTPVLMLTSKAQIEDKVQGFDAGADDYIAKPISIRDFAARVRALLRRSAFSAEAELTYGDVVLDPQLGRVVRGDRQIDLAPKETQLLQLLMRQPDQFLTTEAIIERLWGAQGTRASLANCMKRLRQKLTQAGETELIETIVGSGYRLK